MDGVAERVEDGRRVQVDGPSVHPHVPGRQGDVLGERAVAADAEPHCVPAQVPPPGQAVAALAAHQVALAADQVADLDVGDVPADVGDLADELVAEHQRGAHGLPRPAVVGADVQVRAADAGAEHLDQDVARADGRLGHVSQPQAGLRLLFDQCLHAAAPVQAGMEESRCAGRRYGCRRPGRTGQQQSAW
jgi:hypothetical protein